MKTISCHRKYQITTNFLDTMLEHSVVIEEGETKLDAYRRGLKELDQIAAELRKEAEQQRGVIVSEAISEASNPYPPMNHWKIEKPGEINIDDERKDIFNTINNCQSLEELKAWKSQNQTIPGKIQTHYQKRLEELSK